MKTSGFLKNRYAVAALAAVIVLAGVAADASATYHPALGRWLQRDPIGYEEGPQLYQYCRANPCAFADPGGLWTAVALLDEYKNAYGEENYKRLLGLLTTGIRIEGACTWSDDWYIDGNTIYLAKTIWFGSERSNENAASQLNEALAIRFGIGETEFWYKVGRVVRGTGKTIGGVLTAVAGAVVIGGTEGIGTAPGVLMVGFDGSTAVEGVTQIFGGGEGENGWNPGEALAGQVGKAIGGTQGQRIGQITYNLADIAVSLYGGTGAIKAASGTKAYKLEAFYKIAQGQKIPVWVAKGETIVQVGVKVSIPWKLKLAGHTIEAVVAGQQVVENVTRVANSADGE